MSEEKQAGEFNKEESENNFFPIFTPNDQLDFIKQKITVFTKEDKADILAPIKYFHTYHLVENMLSEQLFFKVGVFTGNQSQQMEVEYQVLYMTQPLQGFYPWSLTIESPPSAGKFTYNSPDLVTRTEVWVVGIIIGDPKKYPYYVSRQTPWFSLKDTPLYKK
ncbi:hypothetical protein ACI8B_210101 [Acinetobacter proteolyticus]|uniref:Uncharacterized protein n=1 Tax=Acinetobacter proteolyticus TaxID=1776741 RepID=A0A653K444_9GAMM|nr:hypothetical protein [Acinetobacter proteolyticus]WEI20131.1 hypothetical protein PY247_10645 [Acinetobacter proteolyticus]VXA55304.1 hypothetical protein ACI8B_210101 [Acinetobacter proteolyticus]